MGEQPATDPAQPPRPDGIKRRAARIAPYAALTVLGMLLVLAARTADPGPRTAGRTRLVDLIAREDDRTRALRSQLDRLRAQLEDFERGASQRQRGLADVRRRIARLAPLAGLAPVSGPGIRIELRDSSLAESPTGDPNDLVIHEEDIQAMVNGLWAAGAEAIAINGERISAASAVRCVGNTLLLHGSVYAPPYIMQAIGAPDAILAGLDRDPLVERFRIFAEEFRLGFDVRRADAMTLPAFTGLFTAERAEPTR